LLYLLFLGSPTTQNLHKRRKKDNITGEKKKKNIRYII